MNIYLARHPETIGNVERRFYGHTDLDITEIGKAQRKLFLDKYSNIDIDVIYTSPLKRAKDMALMFSKIKNIEVIEDNRLKEICFGDFENKTARQIENTMKFEWDKFINKDIDDYMFPNGESPKAFFNRVIDFENDNFLVDKNQLWICHSGVIRAVLKDVLELSNEGQWHFNIPHCGLIHLEYSEGYLLLRGIDNGIEELFRNE